jgi:MOSC domain-containing protein YiiM
MNPRVEAIFLAPTAGGDPRPTESVRAVAGKGLEGDRYFLGAGTYSHTKPWRPDRQATFIEAEAIEAAARDEGVEIEPWQARRNIVTRGVALLHLVGREFTVGGVRFRGIRLAEPCAHMERLAGVPWARKALIHRGGLRAEILDDGVIRRGDAIRSET